MSETTTEQTLIEEAEAVVAELKQKHYQAEQCVRGVLDEIATHQADLGEALAALHAADDPAAAKDRGAVLARMEGELQGLEDLRRRRELAVQEAQDELRAAQKVLGELRQEAEGLPHRIRDLVIALRYEEGELHKLRSRLASLELRFQDAQGALEARRLRLRRLTGGS